MRVTVFTLFFIMYSSIGAAAEEATLSAFGPGEQSSYRISYLGMTAGTAQITVGSQMTYQGQEVWPIVALAQSTSIAAIYPVKDKFVTYWNHDTQRSLGSDLFAEENHKRRRQHIEFLGATAKVVKQKAGEPEKVDTFDIHPDTTDLAALAFGMRNVPMNVHSEFEVPVFTGVKIFNLKAKVESLERVKTPQGERQAYKVRVAVQFSGKLATRRDLFIYYSADEARLPLKIEAELFIGRLVAELVDYKAGQRLALVAKTTKKTDS